MDDADKKLVELRSDFSMFGEQCVSIRDHNTAQITPLIFTRGQQILHNVVEKQKSETGYVRVLLLKSRRFGGSTYTGGRFYWRSSLNFNRNVFIVGHEKESTNTLFKMVKLMQERNPIAPAERKNNEKALEFDTPGGQGLKSEYRLATAETVDAGRSQGIHYLHLSEEAFYRDGKTLLTGLLQCVPDPPAEHEIIRESTANGFGNTFQTDVYLSYAEGAHPYYTEDGHTYAWHNPDVTDWVLVFIPWFVHERYAKEFETEAQKKEFAAEIEQKVFDENDMSWGESEASKLRRRYKLSLEQLYWRKWAIPNKCQGSEDKFHQEYPSTVEEAFLSTGLNVFTKELCDQVEDGCKAPAVTGDLVKRAGKVRIRPNKWGKFHIWERPDKTETYFMCVDSGGGKNERQTKEKNDPDPSCVDVYNHRTGVQAAQWHGHIEYDLIADIVEMVGELYFKCPACVELQNHGYTVVAGLKSTSYPMFEWKPGEPGWSTNKKTKPLMVDGLYQMSRDGGLQIRCKETVSEMRTFKEENGSYGSESGCHDERVDTAGMASQMMTLLPRKFKEMKRKSAGFSNWTDRRTQRDGQYQEIYA